VPLSLNFSAELTERMKTFCISVLSPDTQWIQVHSASAVQAVQISGRVITWYNVVSYLARIIVNDTWRKMSVKRIRLYIKVKRKIHDNLGHKDHCTHSSHYNILFVQLPQNLKPPSPNTKLLHKATFKLIRVKKWSQSYCK
jgi:hypothetical protein